MNSEFSDLIIHRDTGKTVGYMNEKGLIKWKDDVKPDNIDLENLSGATAWLDAEDNIHEIEKKIVESFDYLEEEDTNKFEVILTELDEELDFLNDNYSGVPLQPLYSLLSSLAKLLREDGLVDNNITTPFSDDLGIDRDYCYPRELGQVEDTFNVEINRGSGNPITLTRRIIRSSQDDGSYLQSMVDVLSRLKNNGN